MRSLNLSCAVFRRRLHLSARCASQRRQGLYLLEVYEIGRLVLRDGHGLDEVLLEHRLDGGFRSSR